MAAALLVVLSACAFGQTKAVPQTKLYGLGTGSYVPQLLDGGNYRTIIYIQNFGTVAESYILNLKNEDGTPASFHFAELGGTSGSLSGTLQPMAVAVFHTDSAAAVAVSQVGWAEFDIPTGFHIGLYEVIESADPVTGVWTTQSTVVSDGLFVSDTEKPLMLFDQTSGVVCGAAIVNLSSYSTASLMMEVLDESGLSVGTATLTIPPLNHVSFKLGDRLAASVGIVGSVRFSNAAAGQFSSLAIMGIKATAYKSGWTQTSLPIVQ